MKFGYVSLYFIMHPGCFPEYSSKKANNGIKCDCDKRGYQKLQFQVVCLTSDIWVVARTVFVARATLSLDM